MSKIWRLFVVAVILAIGTAGAPLGWAQSSKYPGVQPDDRILGKADAPVTIFEYASLDCPHCADFEQNTLPQLETEWIDTGKARLVFRDFPLREDAVRAAILARCSPPDQFFAWVKTLFRSQEDWAVARDVDGELAKIAKFNGMSDDKFKACMSDKAIETQVLQSRLEGEQYGVNSTPTFFINGTKVEGAQPISVFDRILTQASAK
jgi:protein-disulfide isomerase